MPFTISTIEEKTVAEYAGMGLTKVYELDVLTYYGLLHDAVVYNRAQTKVGRKWLRNAWRISQTEPETKKLHEKYG